MDKVEKVFKPPKHLSKIAKQKWKELMPILQENNSITAMDLIAFETLCINYGMSIELYNSMVAQSDDGTIAGYFLGRNSQTMGEYNAYNKSQATYMRLLNEFGLTPRSRKNIKMEEAIDFDDPMNQILYGNNESVPYDFSKDIDSSFNENLNTDNNFFDSS